jgi:serine/threonine protein kinase
MAAVPDSRSFLDRGLNRYGEAQDFEEDDPTVISSTRQLGVLPSSLPLPRRRSLAEPAQPLTGIQPGVLISEHYLVERVVGNMGSCVVVKVRHARIGQRFLLKYLGPEACRETDAVQRFLNGARSAMNLRSEHTARTVDAGRLPSGAPYVVTEAFQGSELREILRVRGALTLSEAVDFVLQATEAVAEAHSQGLTHGSLSVSTLFATRGADGSPIIKVLEFGSSETLRADPLGVKLRNWNHGTAVFWESSRLWDTLAYSAPEQLRGASEPTPLSDVWALGVTLHELLSGSPPFQAESASSLLAAIVADPPALLTSPCNGLPRALEAIVLRCLSKEPHARFPSVAELAAALREFASAEAQLAVDRIVRIQSSAPQQSPLSSPSRAIVRVGASPAAMPAAFAEPASAPAAGRSLGLLMIGSAALALLGVLGGTLAGAVVARSALLHAQAPRPTSPSAAAASAQPIAPLPSSAAPAPDPSAAAPMAALPVAPAKPPVRRPSGRAATGPPSSARVAPEPPVVASAPSSRIGRVNAASAPRSVTGLFDQMH